MNGYERQVIEQLQAHGWSFLRPGKGSHNIWHKPGVGTVSVNKVCKSRHTANEIMKQAGIAFRFR